MPERRTPPLYAAAATVAFCAVGYRLMFSSAAGGFFHNGFANVLFYAAMTLCLVGMLRPDAPPLRVNLASGALAFLWIVMLVAARSSLYQRAGVGSLSDLAAFACLFVVVSGTLFGEDDAPVAAAYLAALALITVAVGFHQHFHGFDRMIEQLQSQNGPIWLDGIYIDPRSASDFRTRVESREVFSIFYTGNVFAGYLALMLPVTLGLGGAVLLGSARRGVKLPCLLVTAVTAAAECVLVILTKSKSGIAAVAVSVGLFALLVARRFLSRRTLVVLVAAGLVLAGVGAVFGLSRARQIYWEARTSLDVRVNYWRGTWRMIQAHGLEGVGPGNFAENYVAYKDIGEREVKNPHNGYLLVWAEGGFFALLFFSAFWVLVFAGPAAMAGREKSPPAWWAAAGVLVALAIWLVVQGDFTGKDDYLTATTAGAALVACASVWVLWTGAQSADAGLARAGLIAGVVGFAVHMTADVAFSDAGAATAAVFAAAAVSRRGKAAVVRPASVAVIVFAVLACVALVAFVGRVLVPYAQAEIAMEEARTFLVRGEARAAADRAREAEVLDRSNAVIPTFLGGIYESMTLNADARASEFAVAESLYRKALALDPMHRSAHEGLARLYLAAGPSYYEQALEEHLALLLLYPANSRYHIQTAQLLEKLGAAESALAHYRRALLLDDWVEQHGIQLTAGEKRTVKASIEKIKRALPKEPPR